jgi:hypothetical protein
MVEWTTFKTPAAGRGTAKEIDVGGLAYRCRPSCSRTELLTGSEVIASMIGARLPALMPGWQNDLRKTAEMTHDTHWPQSGFDRLTSSQVTSF